LKLSTKKRINQLEKNFLTNKTFLLRLLLKRNQMKWMKIISNSFLIHIWNRFYFLLEIVSISHLKSFLLIQNQCWHCNGKWIVFSHWTFLLRSPAFFFCVQIVGLFLLNVHSEQIIWKCLKCQFPNFTCEQIP